MWSTSPRIHQEYTFRHKSACRTPAESRREYLTSGKEHIEPCKPWDETMSLWSGRTDYKTVDYQRTNPREYQIVRTHTKETTWIQDWASSSRTLCRRPHLNNKQNKNTNPIISRQDYHLTQPCLSEEKQTNKNSAQISPHMKLTRTTGPTLGGQKPKRRKNSTFFKKRIQLSLKPGKRRPQTQ